MLLHMLALVLAYIAAAESRDLLRPAPTISNSLVNLGKMEISFYLNGRDVPPKSDHASQSLSPFFLPKSEPIFDEPCPCSSLRNMKDSIFGNPSGMLNKLLMNNDLFSSNKDPVSSTLCCESHEHVEEGTVVFEIPPNQQAPKPILRKPNNMPYMPFIFDNLGPKNPMAPSLKTKAIEIFLFPKKKEGSIDFSRLPKKKDLSFKDGIKMVGDKDVKKSFASVPTPPPPVKKETGPKTTTVEQNEKEYPKEKDFNMNIAAGDKPNAV